MKVADSCVARVIDAVAQARRMGDDVLLLVGSDHGQETIGGGVSVSDWLAQNGLSSQVQEGGVAVASQGTSALLYALPGQRAALEQVLPLLGREPWVSSVHSADALMALGHRSGHLVAAVDFARDPKPNAHGVTGQRFVATDGEKPAAIGCGQHGGLGPDETRPFLIVSHPALAAARDETTTSLVDVAPTILSFLGLPHDGMDGRALATINDSISRT
jgi:arylsulfatase A-like enzyme